MIIKEIDKYNLKIRKIISLYLILILIILLIISLELFKFKNKDSIDLKYSLSTNNTLIITSLDLFNFNKIVTSQEIIINNKKITYEIINIEEINKKYNLELKFKENINIFKNKKIPLVFKEETLLKFILRNMKGED